MRTALVHDWLVTLAGAEKVLESIYELYPSPVYTLVLNKKNIENSKIACTKIHTSFIQNIPFAKQAYRNYLLLFPLAIEQFNLTQYDLIISISTCVAKGILTHPNQIHICYCCTPVRYAWDLYFQYIKESKLEKGVKAFIAKLILHYIRLWDISTINRVDHFVTLSKYISKRIKKTYGREATVIYPPVDVNKFKLYPNKENFYLTVSRMVPYKKIDLIVETFSKMPDKKLVVIGDGPNFKKIKEKAAKNVELLGYQPFNILHDYMQKAKAFIFAAEEDFGIVPVEAQACGTPVIAYEKGGVLETVVEGKSGIFFKEQTIESLLEAIKNFEQKEDIFDPLTIRKNAERFSKERFKREFKEFIEKKVKEFFS